MIKKVISLTMVVATLIVYLQSQMQSNDPLFLFLSNNLVVNLSLIGLASFTVWLSFQTKFRNSYIYWLVSRLAVVLVIVGLAGSLSASLDRYILDVIKPLDYLILLETGILFSICALTYAHPPVRLNLAGIRRQWSRPVREPLSIPKLTVNASNNLRLSNQG